MALAGASVASAQGLGRAGAAPVAPVTVAPAAPNLNISPKRVTFDRNHRTASVFIFNQGGAAGTFDISLVDRVMLPSGQIDSVEDAQADPAAKAVADRVKSAQSMLQISPRRVTLNPGQGQTVRLRIVAGQTDIAPAEYRSHLTVVTLPPRDAGTTADQAAASPSSPTGLGFRITAQFGLSIPVIARLNDLDVRAGLENAHVVVEPFGGTPQRPGPRTPVLKVDLVRLGANSLFGNVEVRVQGRSGAPLGTVRGVGVYTEIERRGLQIELTREPAPGDRLEVTFTDDDTSPGKLLAKLAL
jgi:hypothetical protein